MPVYQVSYDKAGGTPEEYKAQTEYLKTLDSFHDQYSVWFVAFAGSDEDLYTAIHPYVGLREDRLTVVRVTEITTKYGMAGYEWLRNHGLAPKPAPGTPTGTRPAGGTPTAKA